jgi:UDP-N-acetylmuramoylalanine--D-glutamate ligase
MRLLAELKQKQILVLGVGITGLSCVRFLSANGLRFAVNDSRANPFSNQYSDKKFNEDFPSTSLYLGNWNSELIANADVIIISPGIDSTSEEIASYINKNCLVIGDVELFCQLNNERNNPIDILAITGSNGKSTVVSLLSHLASSLGINAQLGGNIGQPVLDILTDEIKDKNTVIPKLLILELSSFQLETLSSMQAIATSVLNVSDDHLDRHKTMENYIRIKRSIYKQGKYAITNRDDFATNSPNQSQPLLSFGSDKPKENEFGINVLEGKSNLAFGKDILIQLEQLPLAGMHNALNYLAALAFGHSAGWSINEMVNHLSSFKGLTHRCQRVESHDGITWINDSKATNVGATIAAINGLAQTLPSKQRLILIAGGDGKGADFKPLIKPLTEHVSKVITFGKDGNKIANLVNKSTKVTSLFEAVKVAKANAHVGDVILLSPACASLDMFKNFSDRGEQYVAAVMQLAEAS